MFFDKPNFGSNKTNYRKLLELLPDMRGITVKSFRINSQSPEIYYLDVDFEVRGNWFDHKELELLEENGFISGFGLMFYDDHNDYNIACVGSNDIFQNISDFEFYKVFSKNRTGKVSASFSDEEVSGSSR